MGSKLEIHYSDDWAALYREGVLYIVGDADRTEEEAFEILGVKQVQDDAFMRGQDQRSGVAQNLNEVETYRRQRDGLRESAARMREEAAKLLREAEEIDPK